jgi:hypothetical protein
MLTINEKTLIGDVRAEVSFARDNGQHVPRALSAALAVADLLELPDDMMFIPATEASMETQIKLNDPTSVAFAREIAMAAGGRIRAERS